MRTLHYMMLYHPVATLWLAATFLIIFAFATIPWIA